MNYSQFMAWFIVIVMVLSVFGFVGSTIFANREQSSNKQEYGNFTFYESGEQWQIKVGEQWYIFESFPAELENLSLPLDVKKWLAVDLVYFGYLPEDNLSVESDFNLLGTVLYRQNVRSQKACLIEEGCPDIPLINCQESPGLIMRSGAQEQFNRRENCLVLEAKDELGLRRLTERLIYELWGVIS